MFSSSSFAYGHFQLRNIDPDFGFAFGAVQREVLNHRIFIYFGSGFIATIGAKNPLGTYYFAVHMRFLHGGTSRFCCSFPLMCVLSSNKLHMPCVHLTHSIAENIYICLVMTCQKNCFALRSKVLYQMTHLGNTGFIQSIKWFI